MIHFCGAFGGRSNSFGSFGRLSLFLSFFFQLILCILGAVGRPRSTSKCEQCQHSSANHANYDVRPFQARFDGNKNNQRKRTGAERTCPRNKTPRNVVFGDQTSFPRLAAHFVVEQAVIGRLRRRSRASSSFLTMYCSRSLAPAKSSTKRQQKIEEPQMDAQMRTARNSRTTSRLRTTLAITDAKYTNPDSGKVM